MAAKAILRPQPDKDSYWRVKGDKLIVEIKNVGDAKAKATTTRVDFRGYGTEKNPEDPKPQEQYTRELEPGKLVELKFDLPCDDCFDPDCEFSITVDVENVLQEDPRARTNVTRGVGRK